MAVIARRHRLTAASEGLGDGLYCGGTSRWAPLALKGRLKDDNRRFIRSGSRIKFEDPFEFGGAPAGVMRAHMFRRCK